MEFSMQGSWSGMPFPPPGEVRQVCLFAVRGLTPSPQCLVFSSMPRISLSALVSLENKPSSVHGGLGKAITCCHVGMGSWLVSCSFYRVPDDHPDFTLFSEEDTRSFLFLWCFSLSHPFPSTLPSFSLFLKIFIYIGCTGSSLLRVGSSCAEWGLLSSCGARASCFGGFSLQCTALGQVCCRSCCSCVQ